MKKFIEEFKTFIMRGNVLDMAVGVIIGGAFTGIVTSLNNDIITPILGIFGGVDFSGLKLTLRGDCALAYGSFITAVINFLITALVLFCLIKVINTLAKKIQKSDEVTEAPATTKICPYCKSEIAIDASRCPHCTSILEETAQQPLES